MSDSEMSPASETRGVYRVVMLPCPFCGWDAELFESDYQGDVYQPMARNERTQFALLNVIN